MNTGASFSVADRRSLQRVQGLDICDLSWAMMIFPRLFSSLASLLSKLSSSQTKALLEAVVRIHKEVLDCTVLIEFDSTLSEKATDHATTPPKDTNHDNTEVGSTKS
jgi:hypothetical protein